MLATGPHFQADMLRAMGVDPATDLFKAAGAPLVAALLQVCCWQLQLILVNTRKRDSLTANLIAGLLQTGGEHQCLVSAQTRLIFLLMMLPHVTNPHVHTLLPQELGPEFNAVLVMQLGKGALLLGLDLGAGFLAEVRHLATKPHCGC
jgi:hypothetical protein